MATFAQPTPDENLVPGWNVQANAPAGFAQAAPVPTTTVVGQAGAGFPNPPGAGNIGSENSAAYTTSALANGSYSLTPTTSLSASLTSPNVTTAGVQQPFGVNAIATLVVPVSVTAIYTAPFQSTGQPSGTSAPWVQVWTGTSTAGQVIQINVPPAGYVKIVGANATSVTYTPTN